MGTGYLVYELLAAPAGALLIATVAVGLAALLTAGWRWPGRPGSVRAAAPASGGCPTGRLAWPAAPARQADPDAPGSPRPRAPDRVRSTAA
jgi:hypothetical protein